MMFGIMVQVKKEPVRRRILETATRLFEENGYATTTMAAIASASGVSKSNIYVYYPAKLDILWAISDSWLRARFDAIEREVSRIPGEREKLRRIFRFLWCELPADRNGFANNMMQALSTRAEDEPYSRELLARCEARFAALLAKSLDRDSRVRADPEMIAHLAFMAFDGFAIGHHLGTAKQRAEASVDQMTELLSARA